MKLIFFILVLALLSYRMIDGCSKKTGSPSEDPTYKCLNMVKENIGGCRVDCDCENSNLKCIKQQISSLNVCCRSQGTTGANGLCSQVCDCVPGLICVLNKCVCPQPSNTTLLTPDCVSFCNCPNNNQCNNGACVACASQGTKGLGEPCTSHCECMTNYRCLAGMCVPNG